jgi:hypothetical protein
MDNMPSGQQGAYTAGQYDGQSAGWLSGQQSVLMASLIASKSFGQTAGQ